MSTVGLPRIISTLLYSLHYIYDNVMLNIVGKYPSSYIASECILFFFLCGDELDMQNAYEIVDKTKADFPEMRSLHKGLLAGWPPP